MTTKPLALCILLVAACGSDDAGAPTSGCTAVWTGNLSETAAATAACATLGAGSGSAARDAVLAIDAPSMQLASPLAITIDLGPAAGSGTYSSETVTEWSALGLRMDGSGGCAYVAGTDAVPAGSFTLTLSAAAPEPHGMLELVEYVQAMPGTSCGAGDNETTVITF